MDINISDLKYFIKTAECKNISKAATELGIRQPSLSLAIKRLESHLESELFIRSKKGVLLTREGKTFLVRSQEMLELWEKTQNDVGKIKHDIIGNIRFGCHTSVGLYSLKYFLPQFLVNYPKVNFHLEHDLSREILDKIINSELDMGLVINPIDHPDLIKIKILNDEVSLWGNKKTAVPKYLANATLICDPSLMQSKEILKKLKKSKIKIDALVHSGSLENITNLVDSGVGVGIIPSRVVKESGKKLIKLDKTPIFKDELYLVFRYEQRNLKLLTEVKNAIINGLKP